MIQRFGRVNRFGWGDATISVVYSALDTKSADLDDRARAYTLRLLESLPVRGDGKDASPQALRQLAAAEIICGPLRPAHPGPRWTKHAWTTGR